MKRFEVWVTVWSEEFARQIKKVAGQFDEYFCAKMFKEAYEKHFSATAEIVEYVRK